MQKEIYLAAGCFWGAEKAFKSLNGVIDTTVGYANGVGNNVTYQQVKTGTTGHKETVKVIYDDNIITLDKLLKAFFICVDPTLKNQQGHDIGTQYQSGVYYLYEESKKICIDYFEQEKKKWSEFYTELLPLNIFVEAEEYHQDYLVKNPNGYCHINLEQYALVKALNE